MKLLLICLLNVVFTFSYVMILCSPGSLLYECCAATAPPQQILPTMERDTPLPFQFCPQSKRNDGSKDSLVHFHHVHMRFVCKRKAWALLLLNTDPHYKMSRRRIGVHFHVEQSFPHLKKTLEQNGNYRL